MTQSTINENGLVLLGCGKMGSAMLQGWLAEGIEASAVTIIDPYPSDWVQNLVTQGVSLNTELPVKPAVCILAVKPQMMGEALPSLQALGNGETLFVSIAAGTPISSFEASLGTKTPIIRTMPNTPAAIGRGITALIGNAHINAAQMEMAEGLLAAVGQTVCLEEEAQMDAVTAVSGSGPAYVFHLIETMAAAGEAQGLSPDLALKLAKATVGGAGDLAEQSDESPSQLRVNVTSPNGTTAAALEVLMDAESGFPKIVSEGIKAAADRSKELGS
jgi:pyrroline-5-carboxylate reductase